MGADFDEYCRVNLTDKNKVLRDALEKIQHVIEVPEDISKRARRAVERMLTAA